MTPPRHRRHPLPLPIQTTIYHQQTCPNNTKPIMDTFESFTNLPSELRIKIWKFGFPEPRVVPVRFNRASQQYTSTSAPPALVHACSQSRSIFLETYTKLILSPRYTSTVFIDFAHDTIFFDNLDCSPDGDLSYDLALSPHAD